MTVSSPCCSTDSTGNPPCVSASAAALASRGRPGRYSLSHSRLIFIGDGQSIRVRRRVKLPASGKRTPYCPKHPGQLGLIPAGKQVNHRVIDELNLQTLDPALAINRTDAYM